MSSLSDRVRRLATRAVPDKWVRLKLERPLASVTFDDFPRSAWETGGPVLHRHGVRGTFYASGRFSGAREDGLDYFDADTLRAVHAAGHEIGCHTYGHANGPKTASDTLLADLDRNAAFVHEAVGDDVRLSSFAYPYGEISPRTKRLYAPRFASARGVHDGVNAGVVDLAELRGEPIERRSWSKKKIEAAVAAAVARKGWLIFFTHDVSADPSPYGCTPAMLDHALTRLREAGVETLPVKHALAKATFG